MFRPFKPRTDVSRRPRPALTSQGTPRVTSQPQTTPTETLTITPGSTVKMKEQLYGWYPPARSIWDRRKEPSTYHKECLYKHGTSRYNSRQGVCTPQPPTPINAMHPPTPGSRRSSTSRPPSSQTRTETPPTGLSISGFRPPSVGSVRQTTMSLKRYRKAPPPPPPARPTKAWACKLASTDEVAAAPLLQHQLASPSKDRISVDDLPTSGSGRPESASSAPPLQRQASRTQSATVHRPRITPPTRPTKSAGSSRLRTEATAEVAATEAQKRVRIDTGRNQREPPTPADTTTIPLPPSGSPPSPPLSSDERPEAPAPPSETDENESTAGSLLEEATSCNDYEEALDKYGWKFEIPGDPLNLKTPYLPARLPYTVKVPIPTVAPNPPRGHMMNYDTYFYNTIPRKPLSFSIHQEWISEVLHAKRMDLQKRHGTNYNHKQFAFIY